MEEIPSNRNILKLIKLLKNNLIKIYIILEHINPSVRTTKILIFKSNLKIVIIKFKYKRETNVRLNRFLILDIRN